MTVQAWIPADTFGTRLLIARKQRGLTVEVAAKRCGVAHPTGTTWENGARPRDLVAAVQKISAALVCDRDWLMWGGALASAGPTGPAGPGTTGRKFGDSHRDFATAA